MKKLTNTSGFTLLEIIIVIIIVGVLASLALPRFFATVEFSRSTEAFAALTSMRGSLERCYLQKSGTYVGCNSFTSLDIENPGSSPNAHFVYTFTGTYNAVGYAITATRTTLDGGSASSGITVTQDASGVTRSGSTKFQNIS